VDYTRSRPAVHASDQFWARFKIANRLAFLPSGRAYLACKREKRGFCTSDEGPTLPRTIGWRP
jgi:hypothetical protein